jgi:hypothetical protein
MVDPVVVVAVPAEGTKVVAAVADIEVTSIQGHAVEVLPVVGRNWSITTRSSESGELPRFIFDEMKNPAL